MKLLTFALFSILAVQSVFGCGVREDADRIVGGQEAEEHRWPWQASLRKVNWGYFHICGATVINEYWLVTASHCVDGGSTSSLAIVVGDHNKKTVEESEVTHQLERIIMHEDYDRNSLGTGEGLPHDIALLKVAKPISFNEYVQPACMPESEDFSFLGNNDCWITGWGYTKGPQDENVLQELNVEVITNAQCQNYHVRQAIQDSHICVSPGNEGACNGDSGGPLVCNVNGQYVLAGATSWGVSGCVTNHPTVYTRVSSYLDWITRNTQ